jgi:hypothetical protein
MMVLTFDEVGALPTLGHRQIQGRPVITQHATFRKSAAVLFCSLLKS